jgi:hypothetical protein
MHPPARAPGGRKRARDGDGDEPASTAAGRAAAAALIASPGGLSLLLEVRALLGAMAAQREQVDGRLRGIDARLGALAGAPV